MMRLAFILLTLGPLLTAQEEGVPAPTPEDLPWHPLAAGLPPGTILLPHVGPSPPAFA